MLSRYRAHVWRDGFFPMSLSYILRWYYLFIPTPSGGFRQIETFKATGGQVGVSAR